MGVTVTLVYMAVRHRLQGCKFVDLLCQVAELISVISVGTILRRLIVRVQRMSCVSKSWGNNCFLCKNN